MYGSPVSLRGDVSQQPPPLTVLILQSGELLLQYEQLLAQQAVQNRLVFAVRLLLRVLWLVARERGWLWCEMRSLVDGDRRISGQPRSNVDFSSPF